MGQGLQDVLKRHGSMMVNDVKWVWDYKNNCAKREKEMTKEEIAENKLAHKNKGVLHRIGEGRIGYGEKRD